MKPKSSPVNQEQLFRHRLSQIIAPEHPLCKLAEQIDWTSLEEEFGTLYAEGVGRPGTSIREMVGLCLLKQMFGESDETVVEKLLENPYWQFFCGLTYFSHERVVDPSSLTRFRNRVGVKGMERLLAESVAVAMRAKLLSKRDCQRVVVDTTVQEKNITYPTDAKLLERARTKLVKAAKKRGIRLRRSYARVGKKHFLQSARYAHAKQFRRAQNETKKLRTCTGRVLRDLSRKCPHPDAQLQTVMERAQRILEQKKEDTHKLYSFHAPEVECMTKGKAHRRYEFGCKVGVVCCAKSSWVLAVHAIHGYRHDSQTLVESLQTATNITGVSPTQAFCDKAYRGTQTMVPEGVKVVVSGQRGCSRSLRRWMKRRNSIEPVIGHLKHDTGMKRNFLKGRIGDAMNALLAACAFNFRKLLAVWLRLVFFVLVWDKKWSQTPLVRCIPKPFPA